MRAKMVKLGAGVLFFAFAVLLPLSVAHASPDFVALFTAQYPGSATAAASCQVCHVNADPDNQGIARNVYGAAWASNGHNFANVEALNSDGVPGTNLEEIQAGTQPGWCVKTTTGCLQQTGTPPAGTLDGGGTAANGPPVLDPIGPQTVLENQLLTFTATATDSNVGQTLTFSGGSLPTGATLTPAGVFSWTPTFAQAGNYNVTITVTDNGTPAASDFETFTITVGNVNRPPVLGAIGAKTGNEGQLLTFTTTATDPDGNALTFSGGNLPTGATLTPAGVFSWTPATGQAASYPNVTITVTDNGTPMQTASETFTITVVTGTNANQPPVLAPIGAQTVNEGQLLTFTTTATDPDGNALTFSGGTTLPAGATLTEAGVFSWTPTVAQAGTHNVTITVTDNGAPAMSDFETFTITVGANVNRPPALSPSPIGDRTVTVLQTLTIAITASDPDGGALSFSGDNLPNGATLNDHQNGTATFSWTPTTGQAGSYPNVTITVTDGALTDSEIFTITVQEAPPPSTGLDYDVVSFTATSQVTLGSKRAVRLRVAVKNVGTAEEAVPVTLVGLKDGVEVYRRTRQVSAPVGTTVTRRFRSYTPTSVGTIEWTVTIEDLVPAHNTATATTTVVQSHGEQEREREDESSGSEGESSESED